MEQLHQQEPEIQLKGDNGEQSDHTNLSLNETDNLEDLFASQDASGKFLLNCNICLKAFLCITDMS